MRVLFGEGIVKEVENVEVKPLDFGDGKISGTEIDFSLVSGDHIKYIYSGSMFLFNFCKFFSKARGCRGFVYW